MVQDNTTAVSGDSAKFHVDVNGKSSLDPHITQTVMEQVRVVAQERAKDLTLDSNVVLLGLDSLERMDIIGRLEDIFFVHVSESVLAEIETCREISLAIQTEQQSQQSDDGIPPEYYVLEQMPEYVDLRRQLDAMAAAGVDDPFFTVHEAISNNLTRINGQELINYSGNNYLGMSGDPEVTKAAQEALERYGTSVSASRLVSGTRPIHNELEAEISEFIGAEDSITFTSGHSTNATVIGHLMGRADLILHDELVHNSIIAGALLSGATRRSFPHNDWQALDSILKHVRDQYRKVIGHHRRRLQYGRRLPRRTKVR